MTDIELSGIQLPNGQTLVYTTEPGVVLQHLSTQPYGSSGVVDMAWMKAAHIVGRQYTDREIKNGWPLEIEPHRLACLQFPEGGNDQSNLNTMLLAYCERGRLKCRAFIRGDHYALLPGGCRELIETWTDYSITAPVFAAWLTAQGMEPSPHVAAWFKALGISTQAVPAPAQNAATPAPVLDGASNATETKEQRQDRRLQACIDAGLPMDTKAVLSRLPDGVGKVADSEGVTRQAFSADVKAALKRREIARREGTVHRA